MKTLRTYLIAGFAGLALYAGSVQAQFVTYTSHGYAIVPPACISDSLDFETPVVYQQPVVYNAPVTYYGPVYYMNSGSQSETYSSCQPQPCVSSGSSVFVMGGSRGGYGYTSAGLCRQNVVVFGRSGGWFGR